MVSHFKTTPNYEFSQRTARKVFRTEESEMEALQYIIFASDKSKGSIVPVQCT
jgi:hypothetical protein